MSAKYSRKYSGLVALATAALLAGCAAAPPSTRVHVPVPVACQEQEPERPVMPTESLAPGAPPWVLHQSALAEIDRREGYEARLRAALLICTAPVAAKPAEGAK